MAREFLKILDSKGEEEGLLLSLEMNIKKKEYMPFCDVC